MKVLTSINVIKPDVKRSGHFTRSDVLRHFPSTESDLGDLSRGGCKENVEHGSYRQRLSTFDDGGTRKGADTAVPQTHLSTVVQGACSERHGEYVLKEV